MALEKRSTFVDTGCIWVKMVAKISKSVPKVIKGVSKVSKMVSKVSKTVTNVFKGRKGL